MLALLMSLQVLAERLFYLLQADLESAACPQSLSHQTPGQLSYFHAKQPQV